MNEVLKIFDSSSNKKKKKCDEKKHKSPILQNKK